MSVSSKFKIFNVNDGSLKKDLSEEIKNLAYCNNYNSEKNTLDVFTSKYIREIKTTMKQKYEYNFITNKVKLIEVID